MDQTKLCGAGIGLLGGWLLFGAIQTIATGLTSGSSLWQTFDAAFSLRFLVALTAFVAGVAALSEVKGDAFLAGFATVFMGVLTLSMILTGVDKTVWRDEIIYLFILTALYLGILAAREKSEMAQNKHMQKELAEIAKEQAAIAAETKS